MTSDEIRQKFLEFFEARGHKVVPSASLVPEDDPSVLFTTAGMQQFKSYYTGTKDAQADFDTLNIVSAQKCVRTSDIDEVGDNTHLTFFEMLGNFSFGGYGKEEAIKYAYEFITQELNLKISHVSIFGGSDILSKDEESKNIWLALGVDDIREEGITDVFWGPTGQAGPCGPTTEIYCQNASGQEIEVWNIVFNEFICDGSREELLAGKIKLTPLAITGIDTGMGLERLLVIINKKENIFETDLFAPIMSEIIQQSASSTSLPQAIKAIRIMADHARTAVFLISADVTPSNTERGYVLRRIIRRAVRYADQMQSDNNVLRQVAEVVIEKYKKIYPELDQNREEIFTELTREENKFRQTLTRGIKALDQQRSGRTNSVTGKFLFDLYQTFGFPLELAIEELKTHGQEFVTEVETELKDEFSQLTKKHQAISKVGAEQKFKGGLAGTGEIETKYHTTTHLLLASLRTVLGEDIKQKGSNITAERLRFDFNWPTKLTDEQIKGVEDLVNEKIQAKIPVEMLELPKDEALKIVTTLSFDLSKYGETVKVYKIGDFSAEFCGGPHVANTGDLASTSSAQVAKFKITKEEAVATSVRRIKAVLD